MNLSPKLNSDKSTASVRTRSENGSKVSDFETTMGDHHDKHLTKESSANVLPHNLGRSSMCGTKVGQQTSSTTWGIQGPLSIQTNGSIGQTLIDADGNAIAWTTDEFVAQVICRMLNDWKGSELCL